MELRCDVPVRPRVSRCTLSEATRQVGHIGRDTRTTQHTCPEGSSHSNNTILCFCYRAVAQWLVAPDTQFLLEFVRPDFLMLRVSGDVVDAACYNQTEENILDLQECRGFCAGDQQRTRSLERHLSVRGMG